MSRVFAAECEAGVVKIEGLIVDAEVLTAGVESSTGIVILDGLKAYYVASSTNDLKLIIEKVIAIIEDIASNFTTIGNALTSIASGMTGASTAPPPTLPTAVSNISTKVSELNATKEELNTLKGNLI